MGTNNDRGGRKRLPPHLVAVIRKNSGLVHAIACEIIEKCYLALANGEGPKDLLARVSDVVSQKVRHLKNETLGRIVSVGRGVIKDDYSPTCMNEVHDDPSGAWLAQAGKLSGRKLLEGLAVTIIVGRMYDVLFDRLDESKTQAA